MAVMRLGYAHVRVTDLAEAKDHYANTMGLYETLSEGNKVYYKAWDEWDHHSVVLEEGGVGLVKYGWKVQYSSDIDEIEKKAQTFGVTVERMSKGENPEIGDGIRFTTPSDHVFEVYHEATLIGTEVGTHNPDAFPRHLVGVGVPALDHSLITAEDPGMMDRFRYLKPALAAVLVIIGTKMLAHGHLKEWLGAAFNYYVMAVVLAVIATGVITSLVVTRRDTPSPAAPTPA